MHARYKLKALYRRLDCNPEDTNMCFGKVCVYNPFLCNAKVGSVGSNAVQTLEDRDCMFLRNDCTETQIHAAPQARRPTPISP